METLIIDNIVICCHKGIHIGPYIQDYDFSIVTFPDRIVWSKGIESTTSKERLLLGGVFCFAI